MKRATMTLAGLLLAAGLAHAEPRILLSVADPLDPCVVVTGCGGLFASQPDTGTFVLRVVLNDIHGATSARFGIQMPVGYAIKDEEFCDSFGFLHEIPATGEVQVSLSFGSPATRPTQTLLALRIHAPAAGTIAIAPRSDDGMARVTLDEVFNDIPANHQGTLLVGGGAGALPCTDGVPVAVTSWSGLKSRYGR